MNSPSQPNNELKQPEPSGLVEALIRLSLIGFMAVLCYQVFSPFITLMVWALILAVAIYPLHQMIARKIGGRQGGASILIMIGGVLLIITPTALLLNSLGDFVRGLIHDVQNNTLTIPAPRAGVEDWPIVGAKVYSFWSAAHTDLPVLVQSLQPKLGDIAKQSLAMVASIGGAILQFLASFVIAGIFMTYGEAGTRRSHQIFERVVGKDKGAAFTKLAISTIRAVAQGVIGVAFIQAIIIGLVLLVAGVPWAGVLSVIALVFCIAQLPAFIVTLPAIIFLWLSGDYGTGAAIAYTIVLSLAGLIDNVLKPWMMSRGVESPLPVILLGALGGMVTAGILGMFVGATVLAMGYQIFMNWVDVDSASR